MTLGFRIAAIAIFAAALAMTPPPAQAADPAKAEQLIAVLKVDKQMEQMRAILQKSFEQGLEDAARKHGMTPAEIDHGKPILVAVMMKSFDETFSWDYMKPQFVRIYEEELTDDEIDAAIAYYSSPQGQSMLAKFPVLMKRGVDIGMARGREMGPKLDEAMEAAIKQIRADAAKETKANVVNAMKQVRAEEAKDAPAAPAPAADDKTKTNDPPKK